MNGWGRFRNVIKSITIEIGTRYWRFSSSSSSSSFSFLRYGTLLYQYCTLLDTIPILDKFTLSLSFPLSLSDKKTPPPHEPLRTALHGTFIMIHTQGCCMQTLLFPPTTHIHRSIHPTHRSIQYIYIYIFWPFLPLPYLTFYL